MKTVKGNQPLKSQWSAIRRQITPKIGQLTHDIDSVMRIVSLFPLLFHHLKLKFPDPTTHRNHLSVRTTSSRYLLRCSILTSKSHSPSSRNRGHSRKTKRYTPGHGRRETPRYTRRLFRHFLREARAAVRWVACAVSNSFHRFRRYYVERIGTHKGDGIPDE
jgi:hypothetical protein